jgi:hypothetical protein
VFQAVTKIMDWTRDNLNWVSGYPEDALWIFQDSQHRCDCTGFARLPIAFLRSIGIPARYVGGYVIPDTFWVPGPPGVWWRAFSGRGTHAWLEVYYPNSGWIPYDANSYYHFVNTYRHKRAQGLDEQYCASEVSCGYYGSPPSIGIAATPNTNADDYLFSLEFVDTLPTPQRVIISDKVIPLTGIEEEPAANNELPCNFSLFQNYPNPFNPETIIEYTLPEGPKMVRLTIYNILGQKVTILVNEEKVAGTYRIHWDGSDGMGNKVASGIYFSRIEIGGFSEVKKMVLVK